MSFANFGWRGHWDSVEPAQRCHLSPTYFINQLPHILSLLFRNWPINSKNSWIWRKLIKKIWYVLLDGIAFYIYPICPKNGIFWKVTKILPLCWKLKHFPCFESLLWCNSYCVVINISQITSTEIYSSWLCSISTQLVDSTETTVEQANRLLTANSWRNFCCTVINTSHMLSTGTYSSWLWNTFHTTGLFD